MEGTGQGRTQRDPTADECETAHKLLTDYERLAQRRGVRLAPNRLRELDRRRDEETISSNHLPMTLQSVFPGLLRGLTLTEITELCAEARQRRRR